MNAVLSPESAAIVKAAIAENADNTEKVIFEGNVVTRQEAMATLDTRQASTTHAFFDPQDLLDTVHSPELKARVRASMAWSIDMACINASRDVFFRLKDEREVQGIDGFNDFIAEMSAVSADAEFTEMMGFEENASSFKNLQLLIVLRKRWHDLAAGAASAVSSKYTPKTLEDLIKNEKVRPVDKLTVTNLEALAKALTRKKPEQADMVLKLMVERQAARYEDQHEMRKLTGPAIISIFYAAEQSLRIEEDDVRFDLLGVEQQLRLVNATRGALERSLTDLASSRAISTVAYAQLTVEAIELIDSIESVIAKFSAATE